MIFCIFYQVNLTGSGLFNRNGAEIGYQLDKKFHIKIYFLLLKKLNNTESAQLWLKKIVATFPKITAPASLSLATTAASELALKLKF